MSLYLYLCTGIFVPVCNYAAKTQNLCHCGELLCELQTKMTEIKWIMLTSKLINDWKAVTYTKNYNNVEKREAIGTG